VIEHKNEVERQLKRAYWKELWHDAGIPFVCIAGVAGALYGISLFWPIAFNVIVALLTAVGMPAALWYGRPKR
jgi:hypothetical protein